MASKRPLSQTLFCQIKCRLLYMKVTGQELEMQIVLLASLGDVAIF